MHMTRLARLLLLALAFFAAAAPVAGSAFARHGGDDPFGHDANDDRVNDGAGHR